MTEIVLARHGESIWHSENRYAGTTDIPITTEGARQAARLARWAAASGVGAVWSSDLKRAVATAEPVRDRLELPLCVDARLREVDFGHAEGRNSIELAEAEPRRWQAFTVNPVANHHKDGEHPADAARRFVECIDEVAQDHEGGRVLVVTHSTIIRLALCTFLDLPLEHYRRLFPRIESCAPTELRVQDGRVSLLRFNAIVPEVAE